jgi:putative tryptophan/tyrosine transport system substrate-binding protein
MSAPAAWFVADPILSTNTDDAACQVDRIFKGETPANLPVQMPVKYWLTINLRTAKALALIVPTSILQRADEVIV